jgi:hypothetical protein
MVLSIVERQFTSLPDAQNAALWTAYLERAQAEDGVILADGGVIVNGQWRAEKRELPHGTLLYFVALGYDRGELTASSDMIPFIVGPTLPRPGDACPGIFDGQFCGPDTALICVGGTCRAPCLSQNDCPELLLCVDPGILPNVVGRVCN